MYSLSQSTAPTEEPLTLDEVKRHLRIATDLTVRDEELRSYLSAARQDIEDRTNRQFVSASWTLRLDCFPYCEDVIYLPRAPLASVTSIYYLEAAAGVSTLWASSNYRVSTSKEPGEITRAYGASFPSVYPVSDAVTIVFATGYGAATAVPEKAKQAIKLRLTQWLGSTPAEQSAAEKACEALILSLSYGDEFVRYSPEEAAC